MLPLVCTCGEILANKEIVFQDGMRKVCGDLGVDFEMISQGLADKNEEYKRQRGEIINGLCRRICCKEAMITYCDIVQIIRG